MRAVASNRAVFALLLASGCELFGPEGADTSAEYDGFDSADLGVMEQAADSLAQGATVAETALAEPESVLGTESGNPTEVAEGSDTPLEQGTESGNPINPAPPGVVTNTPDGADSEVAQMGDGTSSTAMPPVTDYMGGVSAEPASPVGSPSDTDGGTPPLACDEVACATAAEQRAVAFAAGRLIPSPPQAPVCTEQGDCTCASPSAAPAPWSLLAGDVCHVTDRLGLCIFGRAEFAGCQEGGSALCESACAEAYAADRAQTPPALLTVRSSECENADCRFVLEGPSGAACYAGTADEPLEPFDCADAGD